MATSAGKSKTAEHVFATSQQHLENTTRFRLFTRTLWDGLTRTRGGPDDKPTQSLEYLFEDAGSGGSFVGPSWGSRICYGTGSTYLSALAMGGVWGTLAPFSASTLARLPTSRLRLNALLNSVTSKGPFVGNTAACLALLYNLVHGAMIKARQGRFDVAGSVASAGLAGIIFKSTAGWRASAQTGLLCAGGMLAWKVGSNALDAYQRTNY